MMIKFTFRTPNKKPRIIEIETKTKLSIQDLRSLWEMEVQFNSMPTEYRLWVEVNE